MDNTADIYKDIADRTNGDIYIGVVGPVRTGKSTFIKKFMDVLVIPNIQDQNSKIRATDELPQSASGRTVMTTEPKFIPNKAVNISLDGNVNMRVKMIDCVGYVVEGAMGIQEDDKPRMVMTPWEDEAMPFEKAAQIGTRKVICEHSTIGILVTTDSSFGEIEREQFEAVERQIVDELKEQNKPFVIVLNSAMPEKSETIELAKTMQNEYKVPVALVNCLELDGNDIKRILEMCLFEFPVCEIRVKMPSWISALDNEHLLKARIFEGISEKAKLISKISDIHENFQDVTEQDFGTSLTVDNIDLAKGTAYIKLNAPEELFYRILGDETGFEIDGKESLIKIMTELSASKRKYDKFQEALRQVEETGYGIVTPSVEDLTLEEPEIVKQAGGYGVKLRASAPSIHMMRADVKAEVSPIVGSEKQSEDMVKFLLKEFEQDPTKIWQSNMFGKTLHELVNEGLNSKLSHMPYEAQMKLCDTLGKIINDGSNGLICILL